MCVGSQVSKLATMSFADKIRPVCSLFPLPGMMNAAWVWLSILLLVGLTACDRLGGSRHAQLIQDGDAKSAQGDFARAINLYEAELDDSESIRNAEVHYKLALLYDDKLNDPVSALHHFRRCLALSPTGTHATDVRNSIKRDEIAALTALSGDSVITRSGSARDCDRGILEFHLEAHCATKVGHLVIKNALVRLAGCQGTHRAQGKIFVHAIVCGKRENFADVIAASFIILSHHDSTNGVDEKGAGESRRITEVGPIIASLR